LLGLPSSSSRALSGGPFGAARAGTGTASASWAGVPAEDGLPALLWAPIRRATAAVRPRLAHGRPKGSSGEHRAAALPRRQPGPAAPVAPAHGTGGAQTTMGVIARALIAHGSLTTRNIEEHGLPVWIIFVCGLAIALGTDPGGWRIIRTLGKGLVEIDSPQGMAAEASSAAIILTSSTFGMALSTTHV